MVNIRKLFMPAAVFVALSLAACSQPQIPKDKYYRLQVTKPENVTSKPVFTGTIEVERFIADGLTAGRPIVYSDTSSPHELQEYHYQFWTEPPVVMLRDQLIDYLRSANIADLVVSPESRARAEHLITARIKRLENVGNANSAIVEVELRIHDLKDSKILFLKNYMINEPAKSRSVSDAVLALNTALSKVYASFVDDLRKM
ncbi:MAG: membrane integrity-associated transporter subunit PqiC [Rhodospirillaceae bacterium]|nr:membrane integrity-associated transporter subunit PqiC [Rhodospirillaceae bacterium]